MIVHCFFLSSTIYIHLDPSLSFFLFVSSISRFRPHVLLSTSKYSCRNPLRLVLVPSSTSERRKNICVKYNCVMYKKYFHRNLVEFNFYWANINFKFKKVYIRVCINIFLDRIEIKFLKIRITLLKLQIVKNEMKILLDLFEKLIYREIKIKFNAFQAIKIPFLFKYQNLKKESETPDSTHIWHRHLFLIPSEYLSHW